MEFSKRIAEDYAILFGKPDEEDEEMDFTAEGQFNTKWGWYHTIVNLADGDITKFDEVTKQGLRKCLTLVTYKVEQAKIERLRNERILRNK